MKKLVIVVVLIIVVIAVIWGIQSGRNSTPEVIEIANGLRSNSMIVKATGDLSVETKPVPSVTTVPENAALTDLRFDYRTFAITGVPDAQWLLVSFNPFNLLSNKPITEITLHEVFGIGVCELNQDGPATRISAPDTKLIGYADIANNDTLQTFDVPQLEYLVAGMIVLFCTALTELSFPKLVSTAAVIVVAGCDSIQTVSFPNLRTGNQFNISGNANLSLINLGKLERLEEGGLTVSFNDILIELYFISLTQMHGNVFDISSNTSLEELRFPNLKHVSATNVSFIGNNLSETSVDAILVQFALLDGTNGTTLWENANLEIDGGTNATPSATGLAAVAILQARNIVVTTN